MQSIYLEPVPAAKLDELADKLETPKAQLLREAVDNYLAMNGMAETLEIRIIRDALTKSAECLRKLSSLTKGQAIWHRKSYEAELAVRDAIAEVGAPQLPRKI